MLFEKVENRRINTFCLKQASVMESGDLVAVSRHVSNNIGLLRDMSRDPFFGVSVSASKDFGLELFLSRLCIGYLSRSFARRRLGSGCRSAVGFCKKFLKNGFKE